MRGLDKDCDSTIDVQEFASRFAPVFTRLNMKQDVSVNVSKIEEKERDRETEREKSYAAFQLLSVCSFSWKKENRNLRGSRLGQILLDAPLKASQATKVCRAAQKYRWS